MFTATRLIAATAVVALGTGTLFFAASPGPAPAPTVSPSPSPMAWTPPPGLVTQELAPGVILATEDGEGRPLRYLGGVPDFAFAPDGGLWLLHDSVLIRVGDAGVHPAPPGGVDKADLTVASDGTLWALSDGTVASFRGAAWAHAPTFPGGASAKALEVLPDGTLWARSATTLARLDGDSWVAFPIADDQGPVPDYVYVFPGDLAWTPDGSLWVTTCQARKSGKGGLLRFDGSTFHRPALEAPADGCILPLATEADGVLWAFLETDPPSLARFDGTSWELSADDAGIPGIQATGVVAGTMVVAPDGRLWAASIDGEAALIGAFDGTTWTDAFTRTDGPGFQELPIHVAPDGTVWLLTMEGLLIIDPEVAMADH